MAIQTFLAMTGSEIQKCTALPSKIAWMACHFSPSGEGLSDLPGSLPKGSMIIVNDQLPVGNHDPNLIIRQLDRLIQRTHTSSILLDLQQNTTSQSMNMVKALVQALPCPVGVPPDYAGDLDCPVFLPPVPPHVPIEDHLRPWSCREIWLEVALDAAQITVTAQGSNTRLLPFAQPAENAHRDSALHCHYSITEEPEALRFYLYRTREDIADLLCAVNLPNVTHAIGLFQEMG